MKKHIIIGTTSINRPELHNDNINEWYYWINSLDRDIYNINWFINIDFIKKLESSVENTKTNFKKIIKEIPITFLESETSEGNFLKACQRIASNIKNFVKKNKLDIDNVIIIWLEDDWKLRTNNITLEYLINNYLSNLTHINISYLRNNYIHALAPSIISYKLWSQIHLKAWEEQEIHIDPEHCVGLYFLKNFCKYEEINNISIINKKINANFFNQYFLNYNKSYYTYIINDNLIKNDKYIDNDKVKSFCKDKITFIRITPSMCLDYGRKFMEKYNLKKKNIQNIQNIDNTDFYI